MVVDAAAEGAGDQAAQIAAVLTERGLGGDDVDLRHRLDHFRRDRSRRAEDARAMVKRWVDTAGEPRSTADEHSPGSLLALAYPDRIAKNRGGGSGAFLLANGRGGKVDPASALAREPFLAVAELTGAAAASRIVLAAPIALDEIEARFAGQIEDRDAVTFDAASASLRARRSRRLGALVLAEQIKPVMPDADTAHVLAQGHRRSRHRQAAVEQGGAAIARSRAVSCAARKARNGPTCPTKGWRTARGMAGAVARRQDRARKIGADDLRRRARCAVAVEFAQAARRRGADAFHRADRLAVPIDYDAEQGPKRLDPRAGVVRACRASRDCRRPRAAGDRTAVAGAPAGAGDARSARLLARQLCRMSKPR